MKKFIVSILAVLYFGLSTGATIHMHYCMGKLVGSALWHKASKANDKCSKCGMVKGKEKCCRDVHKHLQIEQDQKLTNDSFASKVQFHNNIALTTSYFEYEVNIHSSIVSANNYANAPPESLHVPLYVSNCVFRI